MHRHVSPRMASPYVWATPTGATVDVDAPSRGATRGVHKPRLRFTQCWGIRSIPLV
ncbi:hypothetical protein KJ656_05715 [bacterium]|nr:hypothetical protein [bacterium]